MWTYTDDFTLLSNLFVRSKLLDGELKFYEVYPCDGYVLRIKSNDEYKKDEEGNLVPDENGNPILIPYRSQGGAMALVGYDWEANSDGFCAEAYDENMTVF